MHLTPFIAVDGISFGISPAELIARLGPPERVERSKVALTAHDYGHSIYRFQDGGRLEEVTRRAPVLHLGALAIPFSALAGFVEAQDDDFFERAGFVVSPRFGFAFVPDEPDWVTALARHCVPTWRAL
ncbi:hypothetical protein [Roseateles sp.]|uniref:hypothetical protein n=1 Tax=Roseateles sp. TaxID=1971397 RepID=UPI0025F0AD2B|nr:hypothetical protein [Roseateles sp.]MBV8037866.1 hypothetical protein [Roseateles sp.]